MPASTARKHAVELLPGDAWDNVPWTLAELKGRDLLRPKCLVWLDEVEHAHQPLRLATRGVDLVERLLVQWGQLGNPAVYDPEVGENRLQIVEQSLGVQADRPLDHSISCDVRVQAQSVQEAEHHVSRRAQDRVWDPRVGRTISAAEIVKELDHALRGQLDRWALADLAHKLGPEPKDRLGCVDNERNYGLIRVADLHSPSRSGYVSLGGICAKEEC